MMRGRRVTCVLTSHERAAWRHKVLPKGSPTRGSGQHTKRERQSDRSPVWQNVAVTATQGGSSSNWPAGSVFVPRTGELFGHDTDGNLMSDGRWAYTWDGENRLVRMVANTAVGPQQRLDFEYDWQGRRIRKVVWPNTGGTGTPTANLLFVYDGWNLVAELNATNKTVIRSYVWGLDLSGSEQGAGGVGGLLAVRPGNGVAQFAAYDGNGNVTALVDGTTGTYTARYEYGPFGEPVRVSGTHGSANPFRFSTKFTDDETGLVYYGYRYYNPSTGRWLSRDPMREKGGRNLYNQASNDLLNKVDILGLCVKECGPDVTRPLRETMRRITRVFESWDEPAQDLACQWINGTGPEGLWGAYSGFDIEELAYFQPRFPRWQPFLQPGIGEGCEHTVAVEGKCFDAIGVNYTIWGHMNRLCSRAFPRNSTYSFAHTVYIAALYKAFRYDEQPGSHYSDQALGFTAYGYNDTHFGMSAEQSQELQDWLTFPWPPYPFSREDKAHILRAAQSPTPTAGCRVVASKAAGHSHFSWCWSPYVSRQWSPEQLYPFPR
jgi:RHS repeat-associated protein